MKNKIMTNMYDMAYLRMKGIEISLKTDPFNDHKICLAIVEDNEIVNGLLKEFKNDKDLRAYVSALIGVKDQMYKLKECYYEFESIRET